MSTEAMPLSPLVADILERNAAETQSVTNLVVAGLTERAENAEAELSAVRQQVTHLISGKYMPTSHAIEQALWPDEETIAAFRQAGESR